MELKTVVDSATAIGTLALAIGTGVLAKKTQKSVDESAQARKVWERMAVDTARSRLDAAAPAVDVTVYAAPWPPRTASLDGVFSNDWPANQELTLPRDRQTEMSLQLGVKIANKSGRLVGVKLQGPFWVFSKTEPNDFVLDAGADATQTFQAIFTAEQWAENWEAREKGEPMPHQVVGTITVDDMNENGIDDEWTVHLSGAPIGRLPDDAGKWRLRIGHAGPADGTVDWNLSPRRRTYWHSRSQKQELVAPTG